MYKSREEAKLERRTKLVTVAISIFATRPYKDISIDDITEKANCSHGLFYHYFKDKEDIFYAAIEHAEFVNITIRKNTNFQLGHGIKCFKDLSEAIIKVFCEPDDSYAETLAFLLNVMRNIDKYPSANDFVKHRQNANKKIVEEIIYGQDRGEIIKGDPNKLAINYITLIQGLAQYRLLAGIEHFIPPKNVEHTLEAGFYEE